MARNEKVEPALRPGLGRSLAESVALAQEQREGAEDLRVRLRIGGGAPSQRYQLEFEVAATGEARALLRDELTDRRAQAEPGRLEPGEVQRLLGTIDEVALLRTEPVQPAFLPDTVVGILEVSDGSDLYRTYFIADPAQAEAQERPPPEAVRAVVEQIYELVARLLDIEDPRP